MRGTTCECERRGASTDPKPPCARREVCAPAPAGRTAAAGRALAAASCRPRTSRRAAAYQRDEASVGVCPDLRHEETRRRVARSGMVVDCLREWGRDMGGTSDVVRGTVGYGSGRWVRRGRVRLCTYACSWTCACTCTCTRTSSLRVNVCWRTLSACTASRTAIRRITGSRETTCQAVGSSTSG